MVLPPVSSIKPPYPKTCRLVFLVYMLKKSGPSPTYDGEPCCLRLLTWESGQGLSISSPSSSWCLLLLLSLVLLTLHLFVVVEDFLPTPCLNSHIFDNWVCRTGRSSLCLQCSCRHHRGEATWRCSKSICSLRWCTSNIAAALTGWFLNFHRARNLRLRKNNL